MWKPCFRVPCCVNQTIDMNPTEKLIILVQQYPCLYNTSDKDYKNSLKKDIIWEKISKELKQSRDATKTKWKNLKDCYTKYKKQIKGTTGQEKKFNSWVWGPYLQFLDSCVLHRPTTSNVTIITNEVLRTAETAINSPLSPASNSSQATADLTEDFSPSASSSPTVSRDIPFLSSETPSYTPETTPTSKASNKRKSDSQDEIDKVINYLKNKKKSDAVDYLFSSYAETFKKLKPRSQAEVKLKLAQVFTEAELKDLDSENENQLVPILSPSYSFISPIDDQQSAPDSNVQVQVIPEDLSVPTVTPAHTVGIEDLTVSADYEELHYC